VDAKEGWFYLICFYNYRKIRRVMGRAGEDGEGRKEKIGGG
jgi:uncharacterized protein YqiB (DUF1249 family)